MKLAIVPKFIEVRFQGKQVNELFNFELQTRGDELVLYYESKNDNGVYTNFKYLFYWKDRRGYYLSDRTDMFSIPGGNLEIFDIIDGKLELRTTK